MPKTATAASALLVLCVFVLAACGGAGSPSSTKTATLPSGTLGTAAPAPKLGYYAGMECVDHACTHFTAGYALGDARASCRSGVPAAGRPSSYAYNGHEEYFLCFTLPQSNGLIDFYIDGQRIVRRAHVSGNRFPLTCDNGWCVSGEWSDAHRLRGTIRNPNGLTTQYAGEWVAAR